LMLVIMRPSIRQSPAAVHALILGSFLAAAAMELMGGRAAAMELLGRKPDFTGRTPVWQALISMDTNPIGGAGFETFWIGPRVEFLRRTFRGINEAHNGYLEIYLNLGFLGLCLLGLVVVHGYFRAVAAFCRGRDPTIGCLLVACIVTSVPYNVSEAGFRMLSVSWLFLLMAVFGIGPLTGVKDPSKDRRIGSSRIGSSRKFGVSHASPTFARPLRTLSR